MIPKPKKFDKFVDHTCWCLDFFSSLVIRNANRFLHLMQKKREAKPKPDIDDNRCLLTLYREKCCNNDITQTMIHATDNVIFDITFNAKCTKNPRKDFFFNFTHALLYGMSNGFAVNMQHKMEKMMRS